MNALSIQNTAPEVTIHDGKAVTTSLAVADYFQKTHDNVLKKIRSVIAECEEEYRLVNFNETSYTRENPNGGAGISTPMFELTRDAFVLIVMGFTGKKALQWKIDYINAFNKMEEELQRQHTALFPLDANIYAEIRNGITTRIRIAREGEHFVTFESFRQTAEQAGYLVIHCDDLRDMSMGEVLSLGERKSHTLSAITR